MQDFLAKIESWAQLLGPNVYIQALVLAAVFILIGKIADFLISRVIARVADRSSTKFDDQLINLLHRPIFLSFVLLGLALAADRIDLPQAPDFATQGILKTIAIVIWYNFFRGLAKIVLTALSKSGASRVHASMLPLMDNVFKIVLLALAV